MPSKKYFRVVLEAVLELLETLDDLCFAFY